MSVQNTRDSYQPASECNKGENTLLRMQKKKKKKKKKKRRKEKNKDYWAYNMLRYRCRYTQAEVEAGLDG